MKDPNGILVCRIVGTTTVVTSNARIMRILFPERQAGQIRTLPILRAEFMQPLGLSMNRLALDLRVPVTRIAEIVHERRAITPATALRLARYFTTSAGFWLNLQTAYDLEVAQEKLSDAIEKEVRPVIASADVQS